MYVYNRHKYESTRKKRTEAEYQHVDSLFHWYETIGACILNEQQQQQQQQSTRTLSVDTTQRLNKMLTELGCRNFERGSRSAHLQSSGGVALMSAC